MSEEDESVAKLEERARDERLSPQLRAELLWLAQTRRERLRLRDEDPAPGPPRDELERLVRKAIEDGDGGAAAWVHEAGPGQFAGEDHGIELELWRDAAERLLRRESLPHELATFVALTLDDLVRGGSGAPQWRRPLRGRPPEHPRDVARRAVLVELLEQLGASRSEAIADAAAELNCDERTADASTRPAPTTTRRERAPCPTS